MPTAKQFLDALEMEGNVPNHLLDGLQDMHRSSGGTITAEAMAERLVTLGAITQEQADKLLLSPSDSFVQVSAASLKPKPEPEAIQGDPFDDELEKKQTHVGEQRDAQGRRKHVKQSHKNQFESPLLLMGGGALVLLVLCGVGLGVMLSLRSGDEVLTEAQSAYESGSYSQAREAYERYVEDFEGSARWSEARVALSVVKLRQLTDTSSDWERAAQLAQEEIPLIEDEEAFAKNREEFASLLPRIARGLAEKAEQVSADAASEGAAEEVDRLVAASEGALKLVGNTKYVPKSLRDDGEVASIRELLGRVARRRAATADLDKALKAIGQATAAGEIATAYRTHADFVAVRPELRDDEGLAKALAAAVEAERQTIRFVEDPAPASAEERPLPIVAALPLAEPRLAGRADAEGVFTGRLGGVLYAVNAADGGLLWRRPVGQRLAEVTPVAIGDDLLVIDHRHGELLRVASADNTLVWRVEVEAPSAEGALHEPVVAGDRVFVASESGRLWAIDAASGDRLGYAEFAQPLRSAPAVNTGRRKVYLPGEQSSLYTLDSRSLECVAIRYTGHAAGSVATPPIALSGRVLMLENSGLETSRLHVYVTDGDGVPSNQVADRRLDGVVTTAPVVSGRKLLIATETGAIYLFESSAGADGPPLTLLASRSADGSSAGPRHVLEARGDVWIADVGLTRAAASLADSQLVARALPDPCTGDRFVGPLKRSGGVVLHSRVRRGRPGFTLGATDARSGKLVWETDLAAPPLAPPASLSGPRGFVVARSTGVTHLVGPAAIRAGASVEPIVKAGAEGALYDGRVEVGSRESVFLEEEAAEWTRVELGRSSRAARVALPGQVGCRPAPMGGGLLTPLKIGQLLLLDGGGSQLAAPAQPRVDVGREVLWNPPAVGQVAGRELAVVSEDNGAVHCLAVEGEGADATLTILASHELAGQRPTTPAAITSGGATIGLEGGQLAVYELPALREPRLVALPGEIAWGPFAVGDAVLVATDQDELVAVATDGEPRELWRVGPIEGPLVGEPLAEADAVVLATRGGSIVRLEAGTGQVTDRVDLGQALGTGVVANGRRLMACAADATLLVLRLP